MVPLFRCSWTKLWTSWISFWFRGRRCPGIVEGAPGRSSMAWSHIVCLGSLCDCSLLKTLLCFAYSWGICIVFDSWVFPIVALQSSSWFTCVGQGLLIVCGKNRALAASGALNMMGSCVWSIHPLFQSILGWMAANHGYPRIALCSPNWVRKNLMLVVIAPICMAR